MSDTQVNALISRVMANHPETTPAALARYFEAVHQELAPLARTLEEERDEYKDQRDTAERKLEQYSARIDELARHRKELLTACKAIVEFCDSHPPAGDALYAIKLCRAAVSACLPEAV